MNHRLVTRRLVIYLAMLLVCESVVAQSNAVGFVYGRTLSPNGDPIADVTVRLKNEQTGASRRMVTGDSGQFHFASVPVGTYTLTPEASDLLSTGSTVLRVNLGKGQNVELLLVDTRSAEAMEEIEVVARRNERVDLATTETSTTITKATIDRMPLSRSVTSVALLAPGTLEGDSAFPYLASFGGASVAENVYYVNGMNVTNFRSGLGFSQAPFDFYDEYEVKTGGYTAEFGRSTGGVVNAVTKSGGNEFEFGGGIIYSPDSLRASWPNVYLQDGTLLTNNNEATTDIVRRYVYASGPIIRDKAFFHAMYAPTKFDRQSYSDNSLTVTDGDNPYWGVKLDIWITDRHLLEFTGFSDQTSGSWTTYAWDAANEDVGEERGTTDYDYGGTTTVARYNGYLTDDLSVSLLAGRHVDESSDRSPLDNNPVIIDFRTFPSTDLGNWVNFRPEKAEDKREMIRLDVEWQLGDHNLRAGIDHEQSRSVDLTTMSGGEYWAYERYNPGDPIFDGMGTVVPPGVADVAVNIIWNTGGSFELESSAFYVQDTWRPSNDLTVSAGIRHEHFENRDAEGNTFLDISDQWAPRIGFAWDIAGEGRAKFFGTAGRYHLPMPSTVNLRLGGGELYREEWFPLLGLNQDDTPVTGARFASPVFADGSVPDTRSSVDQTIEPMYQDELVLGYVTELKGDYTLGVRGIYREMARAIEDLEVSPALNAYAQQNGYDDFFAPPFTGYALTNPGTDMTVYHDMDLDGELEPVTLTVADLQTPQAKRTYRALETYFERRWHDDWFFHVSYTLSWSKGNHEGYVKSDTGQRSPGFTSNFDYPSLTEGSYGYLPNDRRHSLKLYGAWSFHSDWQLGWNAYWISGRPLNAFTHHPTDMLAAAYGPESFFNGDEPAPRGSQGRTPSTSNIDLSVTYHKEFGNGLELRLVGEVFNLLNADGVVEINEATVDFFGQPDPAFGLPRTFQPPRTGRVSMHLSF